MPDEYKPEPIDEDVDGEVGEMGTEVCDSCGCECTCALDKECDTEKGGCDCTCTL